MRLGNPIQPGQSVSGKDGYQTYTPTVTVVGATLASPSGLFYRSGPVVWLWGSVNCTTGATGNLSISLPAGMVAVQSAGAFSINVGKIAQTTPAGASASSVLYMASTTTVGTVSFAAGTSTAYSWFAQVLLAG